MDASSWLREHASVQWTGHQHLYANTQSIAWRSEWAVGTQLGRHGLVRAGAMMLDAAREPVLNFRFYPAHRAQTDAHAAWKSAFGLELVNHRASEAGDLADLREPKYLYGRH